MPGKTSSGKINTAVNVFLEERLQGRGEKEREISEDETGREALSRYETMLMERKEQAVDERKKKKKRRKKTKNKHNG